MHEFFPKLFLHESQAPHPGRCIPMLLVLAGARASARFGVWMAKTLEFTDRIGVLKLKRRKRRVYQQLLGTAPGGPRTVPVRSAWPGTKALTFCSPPQRADMLRTGTVRGPGGQYRDAPRPQQRPTPLFR